MRRRSALVLLAVCLWAAACDDGLDDHRRAGELGNGAFYYLCVDDTDIACDEAGYATFPEAIGVDGRFALQFGGFGRALGTLEPASRTFMARDGDELVAKSPGLVAILARDAADAHVLDFVHVVVEEPAALLLWVFGQDADAGGLAPSWVGGAGLVSAVPTSDTGLALAGSRERYHWTSSDERILRIDGDPHGSRAQVIALAAGTVTIAAQSGELTGELEVTVEPWNAGGGGSLDAGPLLGDDDAGATDEDTDGGR